MGNPTSCAGDLPGSVRSFLSMLQITPDMLRAARYRQVSGRPLRVPHAVRNGRTPPIMSHTFAEALTDAERAQADHMADLMLSTALEVLQTAHQTALGILGDASDLCTATGRDLPPKASELYAYLLPRQVVSR